MNLPQSDPTEIFGGWQVQTAELPSPAQLQTLFPWHPPFPVSQGFACRAVSILKIIVILYHLLDQKVRRKK